jgi:hypothetical protein
MTTRSQGRFIGCLDGKPRPVSANEPSVTEPFYLGEKVPRSGG